MPDKFHCRLKMRCLFKAATMLNLPITYLSLNTPCVALACVATVLGAKASEGTCRAKRGGRPHRALAKCARKKSRPSVACTAVRTFAQVSERRAANGSENSLCAKRTPSYSRIEGPGDFPVHTRLDIYRTTDICLRMRKVRIVSSRSVMQSVSL